MGTYYTKCGRNFEKSTNASTTGYHLKENFRDGHEIIYDDECEKCPFVVDVKEGYPLITHKRFECRAGSKPPNQKNDWRGSLEDKNTIQIASLHHDFLEAVMEYCKTAEDLTASYNQDMEDCRRVISVSCSGNKKGIAAKKKLIEKFFPVKKNNGCPYFRSSAGPKVTKTPKIQCGDNATMVFTVLDKFYAQFEVCNGNQETCRAFLFQELEKMGQHPQSDWDTDAMKEIYQSLVNESRKVVPEESKSEDEQKPPIVNELTPESKRYVDTKTGRLIFVRSGIGGDTFKAQYQDAGKWGSGGAHGVKSPELPWRKTPEEAQTDLDAYAEKKGWKVYIEEKKEADEVIDNRQKCETKDAKCPYFCKHNDGCSLLLMGDRVIRDAIKQLGEYNCDTYYDAKKQYLGDEDVQMEMVKPEGTAQIVSFDYSTVDDNTAAFLIEKANNITFINAGTSYAIGKELKEAQDKLANNRTGVFQSWCRSLGISDDTAYNYIHTFKFITERFGDIGSAKEFLTLPQKLQYAVSKPSAPEEAVQKVLSGDITSHKQYKEMEDKLKEAREELAKKDQELKCESSNSSQILNSIEKRLKETEKEAAENKKLFEQSVSNLQRQLAEANKAGNNEVIVELQKKLTEAQRQVEILTDELMKPVEMEPAIVEKVPDEVEKELAELRKKTIFAEDYNLIADVLGKLMTAHPGMLKNWARVSGKENSKDSLLAIKGELIGIRTKLESMIDYLDEEIQMK